MGGLVWVMKIIFVGIVYVVWAGFGVVVIVSYLILAGYEVVIVWKIFFLVMIIGGIVGLKVVY